MTAMKLAATITLAGFLLSGAADAADRRYLVDETIPGGKAKVAAAAIETECGPVRNRVKDLIDRATPYNICFESMQRWATFLRGTSGSITSEMLNASAFTDDDRQRIIAATDARDRKLAEERKAQQAKWDADQAAWRARSAEAHAYMEKWKAERQKAHEAKAAKRNAFFEERRKQRAARTGKRPAAGESP